jgi:hypothetical protein
VPAQGPEVHAHVAEHAEGTVEAVPGVALGEQRLHVHAALVTQLRLERLADPHDARALLLREVQVLQRRVDLDEPAADPVIEGGGFCAQLRHGLGSLSGAFADIPGAKGQGHSAQG